MSKIPSAWTVKQSHATELCELRHLEYILYNNLINTITPKCHQTKCITLPSCQNKSNMPYCDTFKDFLFDILNTIVDSNPAYYNNLDIYTLFYTVNIIENKVAWAIISNFFPKLIYVHFHHQNHTQFFTKTNMEPSTSYDRNKAAPPFNNVKELQKYQVRYNKSIPLWQFKSVNARV